MFGRKRDHGHQRAAFGQFVVSVPIVDETGDRIGHLLLNGSRQPRAFILFGRERFSVTRVIRRLKIVIQAHKLTKQRSVFRHANKIQKRFAISVGPVGKNEGRCVFGINLFGDPNAEIQKGS